MNRLRVQRLLLVLAITLAAGSAWAASSAAPKESSQAVLERVRPLAEQGNANAQYNMGVIYDRGYGVERDYAKAHAWYEKAAAQGYAKAAHNLGVMYQTGHGVDVDNERAAYWFKKAAELGEPAAQNNLAVMFARGVGVQRNMGLAAAWAARAAQAGNSSAIANIPLITAELPQATVTGNDVNIRSNPTTDSVVLKQSSSGTQVVLLQQRGDWSQVLFPSDYVIGWVANFLLTGATQTTAATTSEPAAENTAVTGPAEPMADDSPEPAAPAETVAAANPSAADSAGAPLAHKVIGGDVVNIREQPTTQAPVLFQAHRGDRVTILKGRNGWKYIKLDDGRAGWVAGFLLVDA